MTGHNRPVDPLAGSPEVVINSTAQDWRPFAIPGLPLLPILFALFANEGLRSAHPDWLSSPRSPLFPYQFLQRKNNSTYISAHLQAEVSGESKRKNSSFIHLEVKNSMAKPILSSSSTWRANQTSWVCKTEWKIWKKKTQISPVVFSHLHFGPG